MAPLYLALVHYPVVNRKGEIIASAVTSLDLHDLARAARTYGIESCFIVTPLKDQQDLTARLLKHWCEGIGSEFLPERGEALRRLRVVDSIEAAKVEIGDTCGSPTRVWATTAREHPGALSHSEARRILAVESCPVLILFGTAWGLDASVLRDADAILEPIRGCSGYNHLSVRCAAAILIDRLIAGV